MTMSHSKVYLLIFILTFSIASTVFSSDSKFRYLAPLSTNLKRHDIDDSEEAQPAFPEDFMDKKKEPREDPVNDYGFIIEFSKSAAERVRESQIKMKAVQREVLRRKLEGERELKKMMQQIDREHRKYIVEIEREQRKHREEMERAYRKRLKEMEEK